MTTENYFNILNTLNLNDKKEKKAGLTYLSWAFAWGELKKIFPDATYRIYERNQTIKTTEVTEIPAAPAQAADIEKAIPAQPEQFKTTVTVEKETVIPVNYFTDGRTCWVKVGVTVEGIEHIEELPVMNNKNQSVPSNQITSMNVNKAIQRALTKAIARHGLGLYIYANEDLPDTDNEFGEGNAVKNAVSDKENLFVETRDIVIAYIERYAQTDKAEAVKDKITSLFKGKRISTTTSDDLDNLLAAKNYLEGLDK